MNRQLQLLCMSLVFVFACAASDQPSEPQNVGVATAALSVGDHFVRCFQGEFEPEDALQCEDKSGSKAFTVGECHLLLTRTCELREVQDDHYRCCCRVEVVQASDHCEDVEWSDLW